MLLLDGKELTIFLIRITFHIKILVHIILYLHYYFDHVQFKMMTLPIIFRS